MKVEYEVGDIVEVEDNVEAGPAAACRVKLVERLTDKVWKVEILGWPGRSGDIVGAEQRWFSP